MSRSPQPSRGELAAGTGGRVWVSVGLVVSVGCLCGSLLLLVVGVFFFFLFFYFFFPFSFPSLPFLFFFLSFSPSSFLLLLAFPIFSKGFVVCVFEDNLLRRCGQ